MTTRSKEIIQIPETAACWATSDLHFFHKNIISYESGARGHFKDIYHMNECLIEHWNETIAEGDYVLFCGDMFMGQHTEWPKIPPRLNSWSNVYGVRGNHDKEPAPELFVNGLPSCRYVDYRGYVFWLNHFPEGEPDYQGRGYERPVPYYDYDFALSGHSHSKGQVYNGKSMNVCWDMHKRILSMDEVLETCLSIPRILGELSEK